MKISLRILAPMMMCLLTLVACGDQTITPSSSSEVTRSDATTEISVQSLPERPNILLIVADDLGFSDIQPFGSEIPTPNLQRLADEGTRYTNFHTAVKCNPTRAMLNTGMDNNIAAVGPRTDYSLSPNALTSAELLSAAGYSTWMTGKWDNGSGEGEEPADRGFQKSYVMLPGAGPHFKSPMDDNQGDTGFRDNGEPFYLPEDFYSSITYTDKMIEYMEASQEEGKPFFAFVSYTAPHYPLQAPAEAIERHAGIYDVGYQAIRDARLQRMKSLGIFPQELVPNPNAQLPDWNSLSPEDQAYEAKRMQIYAAMIDVMDAEIGRLLTYLDTQGLTENTLVVFMSDNGADATESGAGAEDWHDNSFENLGTASSYRTLGTPWAHVASTPLHWFKTFTAEGGIRTPMIVRLPGVVQSGQVNHEWFQVMDILPTFLEMAKVTHPSTVPGGEEILPMQGRSLLPLWVNQQPVYGDMDYRYHTYTEGRLGGAYVQRGNWKLAWWKENREFGDLQLFNVAEDPGETRNLSSEYPELVQELWNAWLAYAERSGIDLQANAPASALATVSATDSVTE